MPPGAAALLGRYRSLDHHVGDTEGAAQGGTDPVGRLVVEVIGEPEARSLGFPEPRQSPRQPPGQALTHALQPLLAGPVAAAFIAAKTGHELGRVTGRQQGLEQQIGDQAVAGRDRMVRRLKRRVERNLHARARWRSCSGAVGLLGRSRLTSRSKP